MKRWLVLRPIRTNSGDIPQGAFLSEAQATELGKKTLGLLVKNVRLFDTTGVENISYKERNKIRLRQKCFTEIGNADSLAASKSMLEHIGKQRRKEFSSPREEKVTAEIEAAAPVILDVPVEPLKKPRAAKLKKNPETITSTDVGSLDDIL